MPRRPDEPYAVTVSLTRVERDLLVTLGDQTVTLSMAEHCAQPPLGGVL